MDALRILLLLIGIGIILGIYIYSRQSSINDIKNKLLAFYNSIIHRKFQSPNSIRHKQEPSHRFEVLEESDINELNGLVADKKIETNMRDVETSAHDFSSSIKLHAMDNDDIAAGAREDYLLVLNIKAKKDEIITGEQLLRAIKLAGMQYGEHSIFHRHVIMHDKVLKSPVCSLANIFEPGTFNLDEMSNFQTTGLVMFMQLPGPVQAETAFENTLRTAQKLALELDARLCDDSHSILTAQTIGHINEAMKAYDFRQRIHASKQHH